jgi:hypothetical protein
MRHGCNHCTVGPRPLSNERFGDERRSPVDRPGNRTGCKAAGLRDISRRLCCEMPEAGDIYPKNCAARRKMASK